MFDIGIAWFTQPKKPTSGWSYHNGHTMIFDSLGDLNHSVVWITNLTNSVYQAEQLWKQPNLRDEQFLRLSLTQIARETGLDMTEFESIQILGEIVQSIAKKLIDPFDLNVTNEKYRLYQGLQSHVVSNQYLAELSDDSPQHTQRAINSAYQSFQGAQKAKRGSAKIQTFTFPRVAYANYLLNQSYPIGTKFSVFSLSNTSLVVGTLNGKELEKTVLVREQLKTLHETYACLFKIKVHSMSKDYIQGFTFGFSGIRSEMRSWVTLPELIELLKYCKVEVTEGLLTTGGKLDSRPSLDINQNNYSYSRGVAAENILCAFAEKAATPTGGRRITCLSAYIKAYDRIMCGRLAERFSQEGYALAGFGMGIVKVWSNEAGIGKLNKIALNFGAMHDLNKG